MHVCKLINNLILNQEKQFHLICQIFLQVRRCYINNIKGASDLNEGVRFLHSIYLDGDCTRVQLRRQTSSPSLPLIDATVLELDDEMSIVLKV
jgi:hypothetical protein